MSHRAIRVFLPITLVFLLGLPVAGRSVENAKSALIIPSPRYDAGIHWEGETVSHTFEVKNGGSAELRILNVKPG
jgi:hypothetical protein